MEQENPTQHSMTRRAAAHDYTRPGVYHITLHVVGPLGSPFGAVVGNLNAPDGSADAPRVVLSPLGQRVEHELLHTIHAYYPMVTIDAHVIMPDHLHFIMVVQDDLLSPNGRKVPLGHVIGGFKKGCNHHLWALTGQTAALADGSDAADSYDDDADGSCGGNALGCGGNVTGCGGKTAAHTASSFTLPGAPGLLVPPSGITPSSGLLVPPSGITPAFAPPSASRVPGGFPAGNIPSFKVPSNARSGRMPLFDPGYCDVMPLDDAQLAAQRRYIHDNPRKRLLCQQYNLYTQRGGVDTALSPAALRGYLQRECPPYVATPAALDALEARLLLGPDGRITCDTFGDRSLLSRRLLPVVCHRRDAARFDRQQQRCLDEAAHGAVLISARIAKGEQTIMDDATHRGFPVVLISDNGFPDRYHPSQERLNRCAVGRLLLITLWQYAYRSSDTPISVPVCKSMNCLAQALARQKDAWWHTN